MRTFILMVVVVCAVVLDRAAGQPVVTTQPAVETSPHAEAMRLVFEKFPERIRAVDREEWWFDTKRRSWTVVRPIAPGFFDSTHWFEVEYKIDGKRVASWWVDTREGTAKEESEAATQPTESLGLYEGFEDDAALLRNVRELKQTNGTVRASSDKAQTASTRIFSKVAFLHRSRTEVLSLLGDPKTISDYGCAAAEGKSDPLVYVFDSGFGGSVYTLTFLQGQCVGVKAEGIY